MSPAGAFWLGAFVFALIEAAGFGFVHFFQRENRKCAAPPPPPPPAPPLPLGPFARGRLAAWGGGLSSPRPRPCALVWRGIGAQV